MYKVYLKPNKEESLKRFHPWVFSGAIAHFDGEPEEGEVVEIYTSKKEFIAKGHFQIGSIAVRVLTFRQEEEINADFWKRKLSIAYDMRRSIGIAGNPTNNTYRLVHGEGDNLPGLVIDIYARTAVMQAHSAGMHLDRMAIADALTEVMGSQIDNIYYKSETSLQGRPLSGEWFLERRQHGQCSHGVRPEVPHRLAERPKNRFLRRPTREPFATGTLCQRPQRTEYVLLYRRLLRICYAWRRQTGAFRGQLRQSHRLDQQEHRTELPG